MIQIDIKNATEGKVEGTLSQLIIEIQIALTKLVDGAKEVMTPPEVEEFKTFVLESAAFALCEDDERAEILERKERETIEKIIKEI